MTRIPTALWMVVSFACAGCGIPGLYPTGFLYNSTTTPHGMTKLEASGPNKGSEKDGEACATGILSMVAWGDASTDAAKKAGEVKDVYSVEFKNYSILGVYQEGCTQ